MNKKSLGFTLIELLVAVLIIGILAAIALPQYQKAILRTRYAKIIPITKAISDSAERYYEVHNAYPASFNDMDVTLPQGGTFTTLYDRIAIYENDDIYCNIDSYLSNATFVCIDSKAGIGYGGKFARADLFKNRTYCHYLVNFPRSADLCESMSKKNGGSSTWIWVYVGGDSFMIGGNEV